MRRDGEAEPDLHPARIALDRRVQELLDPGEVHDLIEAPHIRAPHAQDRAAEEDVLPPGQLGVEAVPTSSSEPTRPRIVTSPRLAR